MHIFFNLVGVGRVVNSYFKFYSYLFSIFCKFCVSMFNLLSVLIYI